MTPWGTRIFYLLFFWYLRILIVSFLGLKRIFYHKNKISWNLTWEFFYQTVFRFFLNEFYESSLLQSEHKMLRPKCLFSSLNQTSKLLRACIATKPTDKILGYQERPNELEVNADFIGKLKGKHFLCNGNGKRLFLFLGPPDKKSNIRPIVRYIPIDESELQERVRLRRAEVASWVDKFWRNHNKRFITEKEEFIALHKTPEQPTVPADKMSEFYKAFLDKNWKVHTYFNISWYIKNFELLFLSIQVNIATSLRKMQRK